jgi:hypothetical protein
MLKLFIAIGMSFYLFTLDSYGQVIQKSLGSSFSMFANRDFSAWNVLGNGNWHIFGDQVAISQGGGWLIGRLPLANFEVQMEYWAGENTQANLYVRCSDIGHISSETAYRINLSDRVGGGYKDGSFDGVAQVSPSEIRNRWNVLKVSANDSYLNIWLNGRQIVSNLYDTRFASGPFALSVHNGEFRMKSFSVVIPGRW